MSERLLLVSAVRDEEAHLERVVGAVSAQTRPPDLWVIVDDGSTDRTLEIARAAADRLPFCEVVSAPQVGGCGDLEDRLAVAAELRAFLAGVSHAGYEDFDFVAKLDGDVIPERYWFAVLLDRLRREPGVGIAGGTLYEQRSRRLVRLRVPSGHVPGAIKVYRRECLDEIGLPEARLGWDTIDELRAFDAGWDARSFPAPVAEHARARGAAARPFAGRARYGHVSWLLHQPWWWAVLRALKLVKLMPPLRAPVAFMWGYTRAAIRRVPRIDDPLVIAAGGRRPIPRGWPPRQLAAKIRQPASADEARVLLITPARNEAAHIERVAHAVAAQTRPPERWLVVDDSSSDGTAAVVERLAPDIPCLDVVVAPSTLTPAVRDRLAAAAAPRAFHWGLNHVDASKYTHLGKLDGDTELPPHYLEVLLRRLAADPSLGIAGGVRVEQHGDETRRLDRAGEHVPGALKLYTADCWRDIEGIAKTLGWDAIDEVCAHLHGYSTRSFGDLVAIHHRDWGTADGRLRGRTRFGRSLALAGYPAWWIGLRAVSVAALPPYGISAIAFLVGYVDARVRTPPTLRGDAYAHQLREDLLHRLRVRASARHRAALVDHDDGGQLTYERTRRGEADHRRQADVPPGGSHDGIRPPRGAGDLERDAADAGVHSPAGAGR